MNGWAGPPAPAALGFPERAEPAVGRRDPPRGSIRHRLTDFRCLVGERPVPELGVVAVSVEQCVRAIRPNHLAGRDGVSPPTVVGLAGELQYPARHRHGYPRDGELTHERVEPFPGRFACDK